MSAWNSWKSINISCDSNEHDDFFMGLDVMEERSEGICSPFLLGYMNASKPYTPCHRILALSEMSQGENMWAMWPTFV